MKKGKWFLIAGIVIGVGAAIAGAAYMVNKASKKLYLFDLDADPDEEFMNELIPNAQPANNTHSTSAEHK